MKKSFLLSTVLLLAFFIQAQKYDDIKKLVTIHQFKKAKEDLDKAWTNAKFTSKPEGYLLKAAVYGGLANDPTTKGTPAADPSLVVDADAAFAKYREMDPSMALISDPVYQDVPLNIYSSLYTSGYKDYDAKNYQAGFQKFKKAVDYMDLLISKKIINNVDTNSLILAAVTAQNAGLNDEAIKYYVRIADMKDNGLGFEEYYRFVVRYYATKKDMANFEKYRVLGKGLFPKSEFFTYDKVDFAVGLEEDFNKRLQALEETLAADPNNEKALGLLGGFIYDTLYSGKEGAVQPANAAELEVKMLKAFNKITELKPEDETTFLLLAGHFINKRDKINEAREKHAAEMKARTKPGTQSSKEDIAKRDALDAQFGAAFLAAEEPYKKAADIFAKKQQPLSGQNIQRYKNAAGYLGDIATYRKNKAKGNAADIAKFTAEEKKWNDLYDEVSKMKAKPKD